MNQPRRFTWIVERTKGETTYIIHEPAGTNESAGHVDHVVFQCDRESRLGIRFDHEWFEAHHQYSFGALTIEGEVVKEGRSVPLEVPGYSEVGREQRVVSELQSLPEIKALSEELYNFSRAIADTLGVPVGKELGGMPLSPAQVDLVASMVVTYAPMLKPLLSEALADKQGTIFKVLARRSDRSRVALKALAEESLRLTTRIDSLQNTLGSQWQAEAKAEDVRAFLQLSWPLTKFWTREDRLEVRPADFRVVLSALKETSILVSQVAEPGDIIIIRVINGPEDPMVRRVFEVRLEVKEFGLVKQLSEAVLFLRRTGVSGENPNPEDLMLTEGRGRELSRPINYEPSPGVSLVWNWNIRPGVWDGWDAPIAFLQPGAGINASFPRFGERRATAVEGISGETAAISIMDDDLPLEIGAGPVVTLFEGAVSFTYGWNLMATRDRGYFGLGFSFVRLGGKVVEVAKGN